MISISVTVQLEPNSTTSQLMNQIMFVQIHFTSDSNLHSKVRRLLYKTDQHLESMALIDILQRFGIDHHFDEVIETNMKLLHQNWTAGNIASCREAALAFRLLRQSGYEVPSRKSIMHVKKEKENYGFFFFLRISQRNHE